MKRSLLGRSLFVPVFLLGVSACAQLPLGSPEPVEVSLFALNDFHGQLQSSPPPALLAWPMRYREDEEDEYVPPMPAGGAAYVASALEKLRSEAGPSLLVGAGDLIGASQAVSSMRRDEPTIEVLNRLGMSVSTVGNHEFDRGRESLAERMSGKCPTGCALPGFKGANYDYIAANVIDEETGAPWLKPYVIREVGGERIAFVGAVTKTLPSIVSSSGLHGLRVEDEAEAINRVVPEIRAQGVESIVALIHEGAEYEGPVTPDYRCDFLRGRIIDIVERLDPAIDAVFSGHTHQAYACRIGGRLVVQGGKYGALISQIRLEIDPRSHDVVHTSATLNPVDQARYAPDFEIQTYLAEIEKDAERQPPIVRLDGYLRRQPSDARYNDSPLGTVVADAQLAFARSKGQTDLALTNPGGLRADLPELVTHDAVYAVQPFGNEILSLSLTGAELLEVLSEQWREDPAHPLLLQSSSNLSYRWRVSAKPAERLVDLKLDAQPIDPKRLYRVVINSFLAEGGDGFKAFTKGRDRQAVGKEIDALEAYLRDHADKLDFYSRGRIARSDESGKD